MIGLGLDGYEPDSGHESAIAFRIRVVEAEQYIPAHSHRKGQLILALHGGGGDPDQFANASGLARAAMRQGFAVAFPAGSGRRGERLLTWNGGYCCGYAARQGIDVSTPAKLSARAV